MMSKTTDTKCVTISGDSLPDEYVVKACGGIELITYTEKDHKHDGYVNVTKLCTKGHKKIGHWNRSKKSKKIKLDIIKNNPHLKDELSFTIKGNGKDAWAGTYVHPLLVPSIMIWINFRFVNDMTVWINEWKEHSDDNIKRFDDKVFERIASTTPSNRQRELEVHKKLRSTIYTHGSSEVQCEFGYMNIVTDDAIIKVKSYEKIKDALGQLVMYSIDHPNKDLILYVFDIPLHNKMDKYIEKYMEHGVTVKVFDG